MISAITGVGVVGALGDIYRSPPIHVVLNWFEELKARVPVP